MNWLGGGLRRERALAAKNKVSNQFASRKYFTKVNRKGTSPVDDRFNNHAVNASTCSRMAASTGTFNGLESVITQRPPITAKAAPAQLTDGFTGRTQNITRFGSIPIPSPEGHTMTRESLDLDGISLHSRCTTTGTSIKVPQPMPVAAACIPIISSSGKLHRNDGFELVVVKGHRPSESTNTTGRRAVASRFH